MTSTAEDEHSDQNNPLAELPELASLRLTANELKDLSRQGFVCQERRGARVHHKLRFRSGGKQVVRYIGNAERAAVEHELSMLQHEAKVIRALKARVKIANKMLREAKISLQPVLKANGFVFHGLAIRKPRVGCKNVAVTTNKT